jgi:predicted dehydrogenase
MMGLARVSPSPSPSPTPTTAGAGEGWVRGEEGRMMVRIGLLSFAHMHAHSYATCLRQIPGVEIASIADDDAARGREMAGEFGTRFYASAEALLDEGLDGVVICSENAKHRELVELAAPRTARILCEKPIATTLADARAMIDVCARHGTRLHIAFPVRFSPPVQRLKGLLDEGTLGRIYSIKATNHGTMPGGWFVDRALSGGGAVIDHTVHVIDLLRWFWDTEVTEVYAEVGESLLHPGLGIDDAGLLSFRLATGAYGTLDTSWSRPKSYPTWGDVKIEVLGERGIARVDAFAQNVAVYSDQAGKGRWDYWGSNMDMGLMRDFVDSIAAAREPFISGEDGYKALEVALAAYRSGEEGQVVALVKDSPSPDPSPTPTTAGAGEEKR